MQFEGFEWMVGNPAVSDDKAYNLKNDPIQWLIHVPKHTAVAADGLSREWTHYAVLWRRDSHLNGMSEKNSSKTT